MSGQNVMFDDDLWLGQKVDVLMDLRGEGILGKFEFRNRGERAGEKVMKLAGEVSLRDSETLVKKAETE